MLSFTLPVYQTIWHHITEDHNFEFKVTVFQHSVLEFEELIFHSHVNLLKPTGHVMHQQFNIQQLYTLPTLYLCVLYLSENKQ